MLQRKSWASVGFFPGGGQQWIFPSGDQVYVDCKVY